MPIEIITKQKTEPQPVRCHKQGVPLRVASFRTLESDYKKYDCEVGDILVWFPNGWGGIGVLNATKQRWMDTKHADDVFLLRAYDIRSIVLTNDDEPAPVI